jgi:hypothetical protein
VSPPFRPLPCQSSRRTRPIRLCSACWLRGTRAAHPIFQQQGRWPRCPILPQLVMNPTASLLIEGTGALGLACLQRERTSPAAHLTGFYDGDQGEPPGLLRLVAGWAEQQALPGSVGYVV